MIIIKCLNGPYAGVERRIIGTPIDPMELLGQMVKKGWGWKIDYTQATKEEMFEWFKAEVASRIVRALIQDRFVQFMDQRWQLKSGQNILDLAQKIEDYIADSGFNITIVSDDANGLTIRTVGPENLNPKQN
ncbi:MAG: hypothetical protein HY973_02300 [Candidatus Kerfeldbacteria bacterium]|nr:hypothetical protein [Candidatus Kerfeldbacteria bacterium]